MIRPQKLLCLFLILFFGIMILVVLISGIIFLPKKLPESDYVLLINKGESVSSLSTKLKKEGLVYTRTGLIISSKIMGLTNKLQPGIFHLKNPSSSWRITKTLMAGPKKITATIIDGMNFRQIKKWMDSNPQFMHKTEGWSEKDILLFLDTQYSSLEGLLMPDSFYFYEGADDIEFYKTAYQAMQNELQKQWEQRQEGLPYKNSYELLIMASMIEKETGYEEDRRLVAAVLINRLKKGMKLQVDPTVIYGMGETYQGRIRKKDLQKDTPYNTYTRYGLPPTPIAMPSRASLYAAAHPAEVEYLYFVSKGDNSGQSYFSRTLEEHIQAVRKYILRK